MTSLEKTKKKRGKNFKKTEENRWGGEKKEKALSSREN